MERYLKAKVWERTEKSETHLSHFEKWFSSSTSLFFFFKVGIRKASRTVTREGLGVWNCPNITGTTSTMRMVSWKKAPYTRPYMKSNSCPSTLHSLRML